MHFRYSSFAKWCASKLYFYVLPLSSPKSIFSLTFFLHSRTVNKVTTEWRVFQRVVISWTGDAITINQPSCFIWITILKYLPFTSKTTSVYFGQVVWYWITGDARGFENSTLASTIEASQKLFAEAVNFPQVTCRKRRPSFPAENFACICR